MTDDEKIKFLDSLIAQAGEHFKHVQMLVSWNEQAISKNLYRGGGNWFARQGMAHDFINQDVAQENARQIAGRLNDADHG